MNPEDEPRAVAERYARRHDGDRYSPLRPEIWQTVQQRERSLLRRLAAVGVRSLAPLAITEVGCGGGGNLLELLRLGASPERLTGLELLPERHAQARRVLPEALTVWQGDASVAPVALSSQDLVLQYTVFSSLLDDSFQQQLAAAMWRWLKPGGAVLWYDFTVDNPKNRDVRGVPLARVRELFPEGRLRAERVTLAPPLARVACRLHPALYRPLAALPGLCTHVLAWIAKPA
ncbi:methyltransferase domain-containing protein [Rubrivivax gelatinosus]|uniref:SAM-dependent methyltransferase n=1 Tax=Rubrivivax gelatinosus TaxID=28068 RepID=A0ABS1DQL3_RUBGE|nr:SAM-dependent methyltransferase [Rubrivivax gelatinosus]